VEEEDHLAVGRPRLDVVPADAVHDPLVMVIRRVDRVVGGLEVRPEPRVFGGQAPGTARGGNPDERRHDRAEAAHDQQRRRPKVPHLILLLVERGLSVLRVSRPTRRIPASRRPPRPC
jgi:hypothetical protein